MRIHAGSVSPGHVASHGLHARCSASGSKSGKSPDALVPATATAPPPAPPPPPWPAGPSALGIPKRGTGGGAAAAAVAGAGVAGVASDGALPGAGIGS